jgi:hypothetical protein
MHKKVQVFPKYRPQEIKRRTNLKKWSNNFRGRNWRKWFLWIILTLMVQ